MTRWHTLWLLSLTPTVSWCGLRPENVLVVANDQSKLSKRIAEYYIQRRAIPLKNYCHISTPEVEEITRDVFNRQVEAGVLKCLRSIGGPITALVLTQGVPLRIHPLSSSPQASSDGASVDSELTLLFAKQRSQSYPLAGFIANPYFGHQNEVFDPRRFPFYLVARLAAQSYGDVQRMIDDSVKVGRDPNLAAGGKVVIDLKAYDETPGDGWLKNAANALPKTMVVIDETPKVIEGVRDVLAYASWGSNDKSRKKRTSGFSWLPGSLMTEYVSTDGRTFAVPPKTWNIGAWTDRSTFFAGSPQSLSADFLAEGASAATGHVEEPFLGGNPRPDYLLPAYLVKHWTLAEAFYVSVPMLSWQNVLIGDPLMSLRVN